MLGFGRNKQRRKGFALIYVTLIGTFVLIPMGGLAIDFGMLYNIKARLQTACDAAAIGSGYLLHASTNINDPTQLAAITTTAQAYFNANYPANYFASSLASYNANVTSSTSGKTITVTAKVYVPMLLMRVLGIKNSTVAATAVSNVKYIAMMIVVDRSGSVQREGANSTIDDALTTFVGSSATSYLVDGIDTVGMVSFGGTWKLDYSPSIHFQTNTPNIQTAIDNIPYGNNSTNTGEGLYQGWQQLYNINLPGSLNVILLLTDGRPSSFTSGFTPTTNCTTKTNRGGVYTVSVNHGWPPPTSGSYESGIFQTQYSSSTAEAANFATPDAGCHYFTVANTSVADDFSSGFPLSVGPWDNVGTGSQYPPTYSTKGTGFSTQSGYYGCPFNCGLAPGTSMTSPRAGRYAAFNVADNIATAIRSDTTLSPMLFVIGLNYADPSEEALDEDWLAHIANDPDYTTVGSDTQVIAAGRSVYQSGQTPGMYCNSTPATLSVCFAQVTSQLLRLIQ